MSDPSDRRQFKRLNAPVLCRPLGVNASAQQQEKRSVQDISLGGVCVFTDDAHKQGEHLELELFLPTGETVTLDTVVVWVDPLPKGSPAKFEIGLRYEDVAADDLARLTAVLKDK